MGCGESSLRFVNSFYALLDDRPIVVDTRSTEVIFTGCLDPTKPMPAVFQPKKPVSGGRATAVILVSSDLPESAEITTVHDSKLLERESEVMIKITDLSSINIAIACKTGGQFKIVLRVIYF